MSIIYGVAGVPKTQGSMRHVGRGRMVHAKGLIEWRDKVVQATKDQADLTDAIHEPVHVNLRFTLPRPKTVTRLFPTAKQDIDKLARAVLDGLVIGGLLNDDGQVITLRASKEYGPAPGVLIGVRIHGS